LDETPFQVVMPLWKDIPLYLDSTKAIRSALRVEKNILKRKNRVFSFRESNRRRKEKKMKTGMKNDETNAVNDL